MRNKGKEVKYIQMDIFYCGKCFPKTKYYPVNEDNVNSYSLREDNGLWFGLDLNDNIPINVRLFFFERRWNTNCEYCEMGKDCEWNHYFDSNIYCENVKVKYIC